MGDALASEDVLAPPPETAAANGLAGAEPSPDVDDDEFLADCACAC